MTADAWDLWEYSRDSYDAAAENITRWLDVLQQDPVARRRYDDLRHVSLHVLTGSADPAHQDLLSESDADDEHAPPLLSACVAARSLADATSFSDVYTEELKDRGGLQLMVKLLASSDEMVVEAAATVIANCSGPLAARPAVKGFMFGGVEIKVSLVCSHQLRKSLIIFNHCNRQRYLHFSSSSALIRTSLRITIHFPVTPPGLQVLEMSYADGGLGWKVWGTAVMMARQLSASPSLLRGKSVLDLGSGCGLTGLLAIKLGSQSVCLTDCVPPVLHNLTENVIHLPAHPLSTPPSQSAPPSATSHTPESTDSSSTSADSSVLYTDFLYKGDDCNECVARVRYLEWAEDGGTAQGRGVEEGSEGDGGRMFREQVSSVPLPITCNLKRVSWSMGPGTCNL